MEVVYQDPFLVVCDSLSRNSIDHLRGHCLASRFYVSFGSRDKNSPYVIVCDPLPIQRTHQQSKRNDYQLEFQPRYRIQIAIAVSRLVSNIHLET